MKKVVLKLSRVLLVSVIVLSVLLRVSVYTHADEDEDFEKWTWTRIAGSTRFVTMAKISREAYPSTENGKLKTLIVATGESFPDALSGAALAGVYQCPILLTETKTLSTQTKSEMMRLADPDGCTVIILGGTGAVSISTENSIKALGMNTERIAGATRVKTAIEVFRKGLEVDGGFSGQDTAIITTGYNYADALSISPYAYKSKTPIILTNKDGSLSDEVKDLFKDDNYFNKVIVVGGTAAVAKETEDYLRHNGLEVLRLDGDSRYHTSAQIIRWEFGCLSDAVFQPEVLMSSEGMGIATGENFADALASVSLLGKTNSVLMLVSNTKKRSVIRANFNELIIPYASEMKKGYIFGGLMAVSQELEELLNETMNSPCAQGYHKSGEWIVDVPSTCTEKGTQHRSCSVCGMVLETKSIHCHQFGPNEEPCEVCGMTFMDYIVEHIIIYHPSGERYYLNSTRLLEANHMVRKYGSHYYHNDVYIETNEIPGTYGNRFWITDDGSLWVKATISCKNPYNFTADNYTFMGCTARIEDLEGNVVSRLDVSPRLFRVVYDSYIHDYGFPLEFDKEYRIVMEWNRTTGF